jgi:hypothetical protein
VHKDYHNWKTGAEPRLSTFTAITSTFGASSPHLGVYNVAYDIWLNGVPGNREVMIWTENFHQVPAGRVIATGVTFSGHAWDVYATRDNHYLALVAREPLTLTGPEDDARLPHTPGANPERRDPGRHRLRRRDRLDRRQAGDVHV